ncbi:MAG: E3 binding domain-containing protein [Paenibacillus sp.]|nr:E3 binding domain-containing protein [Paenibacillus sp.]
MANERGIDISKIQGTGSDGRIFKSDVENHKETGKEKRKKEEKPGFILLTEIYSCCTCCCCRCCCTCCSSASCLRSSRCLW